MDGVGCGTTVYALYYYFAVLKRLLTRIRRICTEYHQDIEHSTLQNQLHKKFIRCTRR